MSSQRNFNCPTTEMPCLDTRCLRNICVPQKIEELHRNKEAAAKSEKDYWAEELRKLLEP